MSLLGIRALTFIKSSTSLPKTLDGSLEEENHPTGIVVGPASLHPDSRSCSTTGPDQCRELKGRVTPARRLKSRTIWRRKQQMTDEKAKSVAGKQLNKGWPERKQRWSYPEKLLQPKPGRRELARYDLLEMHHPRPIFTSSKPSGPGATTITNAGGKGTGVKGTPKRERGKVQTAGEATSTRRERERERERKRGGNAKKRGWTTWDKCTITTGRGGGSPGKK
ncbi:hypothetical protein JOM56_013276 [Amanita muscaria]